MFTEQLTQALSVIDQLDAQSLGAGANTAITDIDMSKFSRLMVVISIGSVGAAGTVDAQFFDSATSGGTYAALAGTSITQVIASNKIVTMEIRADQLASGKRFLQCRITIGANAVLVAAVALGGEAPYKPANANDIAAVTQRLVA